ncbi:uncharacterized protein VP01_5790g1 [Puccinia sorghi]|uniref:Uncharacterized protein n=1 Tax=Puccinia sorghi TaxID=27349 RepID=A0A0L6UIB7_9BASI|nr:uncharacterized protein VP01_5790g1 [Puccinia sorghi]
MCGGLVIFTVGGQRGVTNRKKEYRTEARKVPYLGKFFNGEPGVFNEFLNNLRSSFFDHNRRHRAKVALQNPARLELLGWADTLMSLYQHGLKENIQLSIVMNNVEFDSLQEQCNQS